MNGVGEMKQHVRGGVVPVLSVGSASADRYSAGLHRCIGAAGRHRCIGATIRPVSLVSPVVFFHANI